MLLLLVPCSYLAILRIVYQVVKCCDEHGVATCAACADYPCDKTRECFAVTGSFIPKCREVCTEEEFRQLTKAFFEKEANLNSLKEN